jgi:CheY-like chemotaxis protein
MGLVHVSLASNGIEALRYLQDNVYDLVLMDCHMPEKNGYDVTRETRELEEGTGKHVPIVALTADAMKGTREKCEEAGMDEYVTKPIDADELKDVLSQWIDFPQKSFFDNKKPSDKPVDLDLLNDYADRYMDRGDIFVRYRVLSPNVFIEVPLTQDINFRNMYNAGVNVAGVRLDYGEISEQEMIKRLNIFGNKSKGMNIQKTFVLNVKSLSVTTSAICAGFEFLGGTAIHPPVDQPDNVHRYKHADLIKGLVK